MEVKDIIEDFRYNKDQEFKTESVLKARKFKDEVTFARLLQKSNTRSDTVLSFMAILEMIKAGEIGCNQNGNFQPIYITQVSKTKKRSSTELEDVEEVPDDVSKMPTAKITKRLDDDIKAIKIEDIPEEMLTFKTPSQIEAEKAAALASITENVPVTPDLDLVAETDNQTNSEGEIS